MIKKTVLIISLLIPTLALSADMPPANPIAPPPQPISVEAQLRAAINVLQGEKNSAEQQAVQALMDAEGSKARNSQLDAQIQKLTKERDDLKAAAAAAKDKPHEDNK